MKKLANGEVRLAKNERRIGNFLIKNEENHIKLQDLGGIISHRVAKTMPVGIWLHNLYKRGDDANDTIRTYIATLWSAFSVVPDNDYIQALLDDSKDALERHADWYGIKKDPDEGQTDADIIQEERELSDFVEKVKEMPDEE